MKARFLSIRYRHRSSLFEDSAIQNTLDGGHFTQRFPSDTSRSAFAFTRKDDGLILKADFISPFLFFRPHCFCHASELTSRAPACTQKAHLRPSRPPRHTAQWRRRRPFYDDFCFLATSQMCPTAMFGSTVTHADDPPSPTHVRHKSQQSQIRSSKKREQSGGFFFRGGGGSEKSASFCRSSF